MNSRSPAPPGHGSRRPFSARLPRPPQPWRTLLALLLIVPAAVLAAAEETPSNLSLQGFGSVGLVRSASDQAQFVRDLSQPRGASGGKWTAKLDSLVGVQANWRASDKLEFVGQAVSRYHADANYTPEIMWAFLKWDVEPELSLRAGRLGTDFFMLSDSRLVGFSYLPVRPPPDYYGILPFSYLDGADVAGIHGVAGGLLRGKLFAGYTREKVPLGERQWDLDGSLLAGGHVEYQRGPWQLRAGYARIRFKHDLPIADLQDGLRAAAALGFPAAAVAADSFSVSQRSGHFYSGGVVYDSGPLLLQLMLNRSVQDSVLFQDARAGYLLGGYRIGRFTPFAGYSWTRSKAKSFATGLPDLPPLAPLNAAVASVLADSRANQHTWSAGLRWDVLPNADIKLQFDAIRGSPDSIFPYRGEQPGWSGRTNVLSVAFDFVF